MLNRFVEPRQQAVLFVWLQDDTGRGSPGTSGFVLAVRTQRLEQPTVSVHRRQLVPQTQLVRVSIDRTGTPAGLFAKTNVILPSAFFQDAPRHR